MNTNPVDRELMANRIWEAVDVVACDIDNINRGGCGIFAVALCEELHKQGFTDAKIRTYNYDFRPVYNHPRPNLSEIERELAANGCDARNMSNWRDAGAFFVHIVVEFNGRFWDSEGSVAVENGARWNRMYVLDEGHISLDNMRGMVDDPYGWNTIFDRGDIPKLRKTLKMMLAP